MSNTTANAAAPVADLCRRTFIISGLTLAGGLAVGFSSVPVQAGIPAQPWSEDLPPGAAEVGPWVVIDPSSRVTVRIAKSEMGQGVLTSLAMIVAEELGCDWSQVGVEYASPRRNRMEKGAYGRMGTGGSSSVRRSREMLQQAGASARVRLVMAAAVRWSVPEGECQVQAGAVLHPATGRSLNFGELATAAATVRLSAEPAIKRPAEFTLIGRRLPRLDTPAKVDGSAGFGIDTRLPGMVFAAVRTCPVIGGRVRTCDDRAALAMRGVQAIVPLPDGMAVVADNTWRARKAAEALVIAWDEGPGAGTSSEQFRRAYREALDGPAANALNKGNVDEALAGGGVHEALYEVPHLAHAAMEPLNCTAHVRDEKVDIWMGTQNPDGALDLAAKTAGVPPENVEVHTCYLGGGFGRRSVNDELVHAVLVSKAVGKPVKLTWSREEDMRHDRYRPQAAIRFRARLDALGDLVAVDARTAVCSIQRSLGYGKVENGVEPSAVEGLVNMPYAAAHRRVDCILKNTHVPVMYWRSVGSSQNAFAVESFVDELAHAAGQDSYRFRRKLLTGQKAFLNVLDTLAEKADWDKPLPAGMGKGIAIHESFDTIVGEVVEASVSSSGAVKVHRVVAVVDCGHVVNPATVEMQIESGIIYGLSAALYGNITIRDGAVVQGNFDSYPVARLADAPVIETHLALSGGKWGGIGEPGTPPIAPALANAIFAATGKRIRTLPFREALQPGGA